MSTSTRTAWQRHRFTILGAGAVLAGGFVLQAQVAGAASGPSALDYAQCSNGAPNTTPNPDCAWINGILNPNNSHFHEDEVTPQRLLVSFPDTAGGSHQHSVTLKYLDRKSGIHAYDYLAAANATVADAITLRCQGLSTCPAALAGNTTPSMPDTHSVQPVSNGYSAVVSTHMAGLTADQKLITVFGATFNGVATPMTVPGHDNAAASTGDDYATTTISFITPSGAGNHPVQLLFGGHLAAGSQTDGWGDNLGASSVSGGPYHIKWAAADNGSVGNRDNQIMSNAILAIVPLGGTLATTPNVTAATVGDSSLGDLTDSATLTPDSGHAPTGTVTFDLYGPLTAPDFTDCSDPVAGVGGNRIYQQTGATLADDGLGLGGFIANSTAGQVDLSGADPGVYGWVAHYVHGTDAYNTDVDGTCGDELVTISQATPTGASTQTLTDGVTVSGVNPTGYVDWYAYTTADCSNVLPGDLAFSDVYDTGNPGAAGNANNVLDGSAQATSEAFTPVPAAGGTTYYWKVVYSGDTDNAGPTVVEACGDQQATIQNAPL